MCKKSLSLQDVTANLMALSKSDGTKRVKLKRARDNQKIGGLYKPIDVFKLWKLGTTQKFARKV
ncbi:MAG: hypothetical protein DRR19_28570 [Candidatus Parabeggiatoa sp. nov. 1]|nr:MAG: hypothetical protein DRR19_28570 [Gammaproteobacteria bacterium]